MSNTRHVGRMFKDDMVRAIISGEKTETRRILLPQPAGDETFHSQSGGFAFFEGPAGRLSVKLGTRKDDELRVKEAWVPMEDPPGVQYRSDGGFLPASLARVTIVKISDMVRARRGWRSSMMMPTWASRLYLPLVEVRVERVSDITDVGALAEGVLSWRDVTCEKMGACMHTPRDCFRCLWNSINNKKKAYKRHPVTREVGEFKVRFPFDGEQGRDVVANPWVTVERWEAPRWSS